MSEDTQSGGDGPEVPRSLRRVYEEITTYDEESSVDFVKEVEELEALLQENPDNLDVTEWLAFKLYSVGQFARAESLYRQLIQHGHRPGVQYFYLGNTLYKMRRADAALEAWAKTVELIPQDPKAQKARARIERVRKEVEAR